MTPGMGGLPGTTRFLHIGPFKTGTTAIQGALHLARPGLRDHGLVYIGQTRQPAGAAQQAVGRPPIFGSVHRREDYWQQLLDEVAAEDGLRPIISSEFFCQADDEAARRIVADLGGSRVHVIVTLRPLAKILPAQWQQLIQAGQRRSYEQWLAAVFDGPPAAQPAASFWQRHDHGALVGRWADIVGPENLTVIAVDDADPGMLLRSFEEILDLPRGLLVADDTQSNRSLSYTETELLRRFNEEFRARELDPPMYGRYIRQGLITHLKRHRQPSREEAGIPTPAWAMERAAKIATESASTISGITPRIMGDITRLGEYPEKRVGTPSGGESIPVDAAAHAVLGTLIAAEAHERSAAKHTEEAPRRAPDRLSDVSARRLAREVVKRGARKLTGGRKRFRRGPRDRGSAG